MKDRHRGGFWHSRGLGAPHKGMGAFEASPWVLPARLAFWNITVASEKRSCENGELGEVVGSLGEEPGRQGPLTGVKGR